MTDEEKERSYLNPVIDIKDQYKFQIEGLTRLIKEASEFLDSIESISTVEFLNNHYITFHDKRIAHKPLVKTIYDILIKDWKGQLRYAKKELKQLK